jgi:hypothetical protein
MLVETGFNRLLQETGINHTSAKKGCDRKTWAKSLDDYMRKCPPLLVDVKDRSLWRGRMHGAKHPTR